MPTPPGAGEPPLTPRERAVLAGIEHDLDVSDPGLARRMARSRVRTRTGGTLTRNVVRATVAFLVLLALPPSIGLVPEVIVVVLGVLAATLLVPWLLLRAFERLDRGPDDQPT